MKSESNILGIAGELRVMSELMLKGHNPAKSYLDNGIDIILESGIRIQVKTARTKYCANHKREKPKYKYHFSFNNKTNKHCLENVDIVICWAVEDNVFFIIPAKDLGKKGYKYVPDYKKNFIKQYINNWGILNDKWVMLNISNKVIMNAFAGEDMRLIKQGEKSNG